MPKQEIKLHYKNVMADVIGNEHGITNQQLGDLAEKTKKLIPIVTKEIEGYKRHPKITRTTYGSLLTDSKILGKVKKHVKHLKERCDNLVILGIGGSALGNIALQTALNPFMYNLDEKQRRGPRLFVFDNVLAFDIITIPQSCFSTWGKAEKFFRWIFTKVVLLDI